jgi:site-specific recombinase XerC
MSTTTTAVERYQPVLSDVERMTLLGFLAGYRGYTRDAYALDLRQFTSWCWQHDHHLFDARRVDIECFARDLEDRGKARATVARGLCAIVGFYRYAEEEGVIAHSPAVHMRRPRIGYEFHVSHLDRNELGAILVAAGLSSSRCRWRHVSPGPSTSPLANAWRARSSSTPTVPGWTGTQRDGSRGA